MNSNERGILSDSEYIPAMSLLPQNVNDCPSPMDFSSSNVVPNQPNDCLSKWHRDSRANQRTPFPEGPPPIFNPQPSSPASSSDCSLLDPVYRQASSPASSSDCSLSDPLYSSSELRSGTPTVVVPVPVHIQKNLDSTNVIYHKFNGKITRRDWYLPMVRRIVNNEIPNLTSSTIQILSGRQLLKRMIVPKLATLAAMLKHPVSEVLKV